MRSALVLAATLVTFAGCKRASNAHDGHSQAPIPSPVASVAPVVSAAPSPSTGMAHQDHAGKNGGSVQMFGDLHTETVFAANGQHRLYLSDATRQPLPASTVDGATFTVKRPGGEPEKLALTTAPDGSYWAAAGQPLADTRTMVRLDFVYQGKPQFMDVPALHLVEGESVASKGKHEHRGDSAPHKH